MFKLKVEAENNKELIITQTASEHLFNFETFLFLDLKGQIDSLAKEYTANARTLSSEQKLSILRQIQQSYSKCKEFGDDKVQLAMQTYEMVGTSLFYRPILEDQFNQSVLTVVELSGRRSAKVLSP